MKVYLIRRKKDGKYWAGRRPTWEDPENSWREIGVLYRKKGSALNSQKKIKEHETDIIQAEITFGEAI